MKANIEINLSADMVRTVRSALLHIPKQELEDIRFGEVTGTDAKRLFEELLKEIRTN